MYVYMTLCYFTQSDDDLVVFSDQSRYSSLTETEVLELLDKYTLPEDEFKILKSKAKELLEREEKP